MQVRSFGARMQCNAFRACNEGNIMVLRPEYLTSAGNLSMIEDHRRSPLWVKVQDISEAQHARTPPKMQHLRRRADKPRIEPRIRKLVVSLMVASAEGDYVIEPS